MATVEAIMAAIADQLSDQLIGTADPAIANLQIVGMMEANPTPPSIDIYPADPFIEPLTFGVGNVIMNFTIRARVTVADRIGGQRILLSMMDPREETSVLQALAQDKTLGGVVARASVVDGPSAYGVFLNPAGEAGQLFGCTWTVQVTP